jgi:hypothetical protein
VQYGSGPLTQLARRLHRADEGGGIQQDTHN